MRGGPEHFTHSKVMAWVALDRAIRHHEQYDGKGDVKRWKKNRDMIHREVCTKGFDKKLNSFVQSYGSKQLDASCLRIGLVGFLPPDDPRFVGTVEAIEKRLMKGGFVERYDTKKTDDGLSGGEGAFLACSFWMVTSLWLIGRKDDARVMFDRLLALRNDVGLLSEEYDPVAKRMVGNFPQALVSYCAASVGVCDGRVMDSGASLGAEGSTRGCSFEAFEQQGRGPNRANADVRTTAKMRWISRMQPTGHF